MMTAIEIIQRLHEHRMWSNHRLLDACRPLDEPLLRQSFAIGQGSLWRTLVHLHGAERLWLDVLHNQSPTGVPNEDAFASLDELNQAWRELDQQWVTYLQQLDQTQLEQQHERKGMSTRAADILIHVCLHARYTTAQATNMLRQLGVEALPNTMHITMAREQCPHHVE